MRAGTGRAEGAPTASGIAAVIAAVGRVVTWAVAAAVVASGAAVAAGGCGGKRGGAGDGSAAAGDRVLVQDEDIPDGLALRLSDGSYAGSVPARVKPARAQKLPDAEARRLLARMKPLAPEAGDEQAFSLRERSLPPPRAGQDIRGKFPPPGQQAAPAGAPAAASGPLEVVRYAPKGDVPLAPQLSVTFSAPMVAVTSHADATARGVPVTLSPTPPGRWRWIGTRTLLFDPDVRFPQATRYTVEVPAGIRSAGGAALARPVRFTFTTPAPRVVQSWPGAGPQPRDPAMFVAFDQKIDPAAVRATIKVKAGGKTFGVRALADAELARSRDVRDLIDAAESNEQAGRWVAFRAAELLPVDAEVAVVVGPGTPSAEGPLKTASEQSFSFRTHGRFKVEEARCSYGSRCPPMSPWVVRMSNPIDGDAFDPDMVAVEPALPGKQIVVQGQYMFIRGRSKGRTTYSVTLSSALADTFGQTLGADAELSFRVGSSDPSLWGPRGLVVLDPASKTPTLDVYSINHLKLAVQLYKVTPRDWPAFARFMRNPWGPGGKLRTPPGARVRNEVTPINARQDEMVETRIDVSSALDGRHGHAIAIVQPTPWTEQRQPPTLIAWVQATGIGLDAFVDDAELIGWATDLATGEPLEGVSLAVAPHGITARTDARGVATFALPAKSPGDRHLLVATRGDDTAFLPEDTYWWNDRGGWVRRDPGTSLRWYTFDDRNMYRPGETVRIKGWLRRIDNGEGGDVMPLGGAARSIRYKLIGPRGNELAKGNAKVDAVGGFDLALALPKTPNLGWAHVQLTATGARGVTGATHAHGFQIQEFRRPEFEVEATASQGPHIVGGGVGGGADVTVSARYYAGGGLPGAEVRWDVTATPGAFTPPNRDDFVFGAWTPWWGWRSWEMPPPPPHASTTHVGKTDATGRHVLHMDFLSVKPPRPMQVTAQAAVMDVNRQAWAAGASLLVHPSELYVGLKTRELFVDRGRPIEVESIVVDHDGAAVADRSVTMRAVRLDWTWKGGKYETVEKDAQTCARPSAAQPSLCTFQTAEGGQYKITAEVADDQGRRNQTEITVWVAGGERPAARDVELEELTIIPDKKEYAPGDTAALLVQAGFYPAEGLLSVRRSGIVSTHRFRLDGPTARLTVPITDAHTPNVHVQVDVVGSAERIDDHGQPAPKLPRRPAFASGQINLPVPPLHRALTVEAAPRQRKLEPGGTTTVDVTVRDAAGRPAAGAELAVVVVDESVLALSGYQHPNPIDTFYSPRPPGARDHHARSHVKLARPDADLLATAGDTDGDAVGDGDDLAEGEVVVTGKTFGEELEAPPPPPAPPSEDAPAGGLRRAERSRDGKAKLALSARSGARGQATTPIAVRTNFDALATFAPAVKTGGDGRASVKVKLPDNLTRYRVVAIAVAGDRQFGKGESSITARMPLMVRPSPPRFLNFGDRFELPVVVQNQTDADMRVSVAVRSSNAALTAGMGRALTVAANDRVEVRFPAAAELPGTARFQVAAAAGKWADASELALPVWTPATTEAFATYGHIDDGAGPGAGVVRQPVAVPGNAVASFGGLEVTTSSTQLQALTDAFVYLVEYPFECAEQVSSRVIAVAALRDVLAAFKAEGLPPPGELQAAVVRDIDRLRGLQNPDGGFGFWRFGEPSWPYVSIHVAHALVRAKAKGFDVPADMLARAQGYLRDVESKIPHWYPADVKRTLIAYALYVRKQMGDRDAARARELIADASGADKLPIEAVGWVLGVLTGDPASRDDIARIHRHLHNRVSETAATASFTSGYSDGAYLLLHSSRRADGVVLEALIEDQPRSDLIPKLARGLLAHRVRGRWSNTQDNAFVLLALDRYFEAYEKATPSFVARVWLGDGYAGDHAFRGRTTERHHIDIPMSHLARVRQADLTLQKDGRGRMYYRIGMTYAPQSLRLEPADHGFAVERRYEAVDAPGDVARQADGTWKIQAGARVRVRVTMAAPSRRYHVALVDPLPAGLEAMNPALAVTGAIPQDPGEQRGAYWWWQRTWYEHQNLRDERVEAFASLLWDGVHEYTYVARATTPGRFVVPPARAEEMYFPETFGRSASAVVVVE